MVATNVLHTKVCDLLGIEYPIMQAGMGLIARGRMAAAVSNAGGLGVIGAGHLTNDELREEIRLARSLTDKPFGVDILFGKVIQTEDSTAAKYSKEIQDQIEITFDEKVPVIVSGLGSPAAIIDEAHKQGMIVMSCIGNVKQALKVQDEGVDVIIAQGHEAGGHTGRIATMTLVPQVVDAVDVPVVAAGGLADGRGLVASLALGACGVWMGTRFIASEEAYAHQNYKEKIVAVNDEGTTITRAHSGKTARVIKNKFTEYWEQHQDEIEPYPLQMVKVGRPASFKARIDGDVENGVLPAGQISGMIKEIKPAGEIVKDIVAEAYRVIEQFQK